MSYWWQITYFTFLRNLTCIDLGKNLSRTKANATINDSSGRTLLRLTDKFQQNPSTYTAANPKSLDRRFSVPHLKHLHKFLLLWHIDWPRNWTSKLHRKGFPPTGLTVYGVGLIFLNTNVQWIIRSMEIHSVISLMLYI